MRFLVIALNQDYNKIPGGWKDAAKLVAILGYYFFTDIFLIYRVSHVKSIKSEKSLQNRSLFSNGIFTKMKDLQTPIKPFIFFSKIGFLFIYRKCCVGLDPPDSHDFYGVFLPDTVEKVLSLARRLQQKYIKTASVSFIFDTIWEL